MEGGVLGGILCMILVFAVLPLLWWRRRQISLSPHDHEEEPQQERVERVVHQSGTRRMRRRTAAASSSVASTSAHELHTESDEEVREDDNYVGKASSKKGRKRHEREAQRQADEAARESRKTKQDRYEELRRQKDEDREAKERAMEEEALARKAKEEEAAALEFEKWKGDFSIEEEGTTASETQEESHGLLYDFVEYIKKQKCVPLEDLAAEFKLRTQNSCSTARSSTPISIKLQDCINRILELENLGRLTGVMDDRGKYIYISPEEMKAVADYIRRKGRVSIAHLASQSNQFIDLTPKPQFEEERRPEAIHAN
ncbi:DDRGK domain-containing protein 1 [Platanthera guangdongensis]|uniref:DDRGK domain-containing protein 1 n=1 Tax=Platanthera guangdongensis TaxID=2320717 RepID=A0ABR2MBR3_9ASPA